MTESRKIKEFERFPLAYAYDYLYQQGFTEEANEIRQSKDSYKSYNSTLKRGKIIKLLEDNKLLDDFTNKYWYLGTPEERQKQIARCKNVYARWLDTKPISTSINKIESYDKSINSETLNGSNPELTKLLIDLASDNRKLVAENRELAQYKEDYKKYQGLEYIFEDEKFMEDWLERNIHKAIPNIEVIDRQPVVVWNETFMRNRPDLFCMDKTTKELVIVENKVRGRHSKVETQYLTYKAWINRNLDKVNAKYCDKQLKATKDFKFAIISDTTDERLQAVCEDSNIALVKIGGGVFFESLVPY